MFTSNNYVFLKYPFTPQTCYMSTTRRSFIRQSGLFMAGAAVLPNQLWHFKKNELLGLQLYSVRDDMKKDPLGTLQQIAKMGYRYVEHANYKNRKFYGYSATEFKKVLADLNLKMPSGHTVLGPQHWNAATQTFTDEWKQTVEDAAIVGQQYVISPWLDESLRKNYDDLLRYMDVFNKSGALCKQSGMKFGYHNHNFEFSSMLNNMLLYDIILQHTDPALVIHQLDIGNMYGVGGRAMEVLKKHPGRFASMHVKDEIKSTKGEMSDGFESTILGKGVINVKEIINFGRKSGGTKHFIIEQESYQGMQPLDCVKADLKVMQGWGF